MAYKVTVPGAKAKFEEWIATRGGVLVWPNENLSDPNKGEMFTPATTRDGQDGKAHKPHWGVGAPVLVTDIAEFKFVSLKEVERFHVATRIGAQGMSVKLTDASSKKLRRKLDEARQKYGDAYYEFDYGSEQNCVILAPEAV